MQLAQVLSCGLSLEMCCSQQTSPACMSCHCSAWLSGNGEEKCWHGPALGTISQILF